MKTRISSLFQIAATLALSIPAHATILYWDGTSTNGDANGGNGAWDTVLTNWDSLATAGADTAWPSVSTLDDDAVFGGTAGTVTVDAGGVTANSLTFNTANYILQGGKITFDGTAPSITNAVAATINSEIAGTASFTKTGAGILTLGGTNTFTGTTTFSGGIVNVADLTNYGVAGSLGARLAAQETAVGDSIGLHFLGGTLQYTGSTAQSTNRQIRVGTAGAVIDASGSGSGTLSFTHSGANTNLFNTSGTRTITLTGSNAGDNTFAIKLENQAANATSLVKSGLGKWVLTNANTYTGNTSISGGTLKLSGGNDRLATTGTVVFSGSSTLDLGGNSQTLANLSVTAGGTVSNTITNGSLTLSGASDLVITTPTSPTTAGAYSLDASGLSSLTISKSVNSWTVGGNGAATAAQAGTFKLSSTSNTITVANLNVGLSGGIGSIVNSGTLSLGTTNAINATNVQVGGTRSNANLSFQTSLTSPTVTLRGVTGGTTRVTKFTVGVNGAGGTAGNTQIADFSLGSIDMRVTDLIIAQGQSTGTTGTPPSVNGTFTMGLGTVDATNIILSDNIGGGANSTNTAIFNQNAGSVSVGTLTLGQRLGTTLTPILSVNYNLGTSTTTGTLKATTVQAGAGTVSTSSVRNINFNNGTIQNFDSATDLLINGVGTAAESRINIVLASSGTHTFLADASRTITLGANTLVSGTGGSLTKSGAGTLVMNAANTYTGDTRIGQGSLTVANSSALAGSTLDMNTADAGTLSFGTAITSATFGGLAGSRNLSLLNTNAVPAAVTLSVGNNNATTSYTGVLSGGNLYKVGNGTFTVDPSTGVAVSINSLSANAGTMILKTGDIGTAGIDPGQTAYTMGAGARGGTLTVDGANLTIGGSRRFVIGAAAAGTGNLISGSITASQVVIGHNGAATMAQSGGTVTTTNVYHQDGGSGAYTLTGGTLIAQSIYNNTANTGGTQTFTLNLNGGTLRAATSTTNLITTANTGTQISVLLGTGNTQIDTSLSNATINRPIGDMPSQAGTFTKIGANALTLNQANTYTGDTTVAAGTLLANNTMGSATGTGLVNVNGGTLGGTGSISGAVTINTTGVLSPGASIESLATGALTLNTGSTFAYELNTTGLGTADLADVNGNLDLNGTVTLSFTDLGSNSLLAFGTKFTMISYFGSWTTGDIFTGYTDDSDFTMFGNEWRINYDDVSAGSVNGGAFTNAVTLTVIPEPRAALLGGLALLGLLRRRR